MELYRRKELQTQNALARIVKERNNYYKFGETDDLPNSILREVNSSGTARECIDKISIFTFGGGFADATIASSMANANQTFNTLLQVTALNQSYLEAVSLRVLMNNAGEASRAYLVPTQTLRRWGTSRFQYNPLMGEYNRDRREDRYLQEYDPTEPPAARRERMYEQISKYGEQLGDIVYAFNEGMGEHYDIYPVPKFYSGIEDIKSDAGISRLELRNIKKGWRANVIISTGPMDDETEDEKGKTQKARFDENIKKFQGEEGASVLHLDGAVNEQKPDVKILDVAELLDQTDKATDRVGRKVCRHMGVPPILVGFATPGQLGANQEIINTMALFQISVFKRQQMIREAFATVWPTRNWEIKQSDLWSYLMKSETTAP